MKQKEIITLVVGIIAIITSVFLGYRMLFPKTENSIKKSEADQIKTVPKYSDLNNQVLKKIYILKDYGKPNLDNIGKENLFLK